MHSSPSAHARWLCRRCCHYRITEAVGGVAPTVGVAQGSTKPGSRPPWGTGAVFGLPKRLRCRFARKSLSDGKNDVGAPASLGGANSAGTALAYSEHGGCKQVILAKGLEGSSGSSATDVDEADGLAVDSWRPKDHWIVFADGTLLLPRYVVHYS